MTVVEPNRIPAAPIIEVINNFLATNGTRAADGTFASHSIRLLAERVDVRENTLEKIINGRGNTIDFDFADRLLCVMNLTDLWITDLKDVYDSAVLTEGKKRHNIANLSGERVCERRGCSNRFVPPAKSPRKRFCSVSCKSAAWKHKKFGLKGNLRGKDRALESLVCRNGHERTAENTGINARGTRYCLTCHRESVRRFRERRRLETLDA